MVTIEGAILVSSSKLLARGSSGLLLLCKQMETNEGDAHKRGREGLISVVEEEERVLFCIDQFNRFLIARPPL